MAQQWIHCLEGTLYELYVSAADGGDFDLSSIEKEIKISVVLGK